MWRGQARSLFVFTFSRSTLPDADRPLPGESYVYTRFSGGPQIFLTVEELVEELGELPASRRTPSTPLVEHNRRPKGAVYVGGSPVFLEGTFTRSGTARR